MKTIFDEHNVDEVESIIREVKNLLSQNKKDSEILDSIKSIFKKEFLSIAKAKVRSERDIYKNIGKTKYFNEDDLRFSTPTKISELRAERLKCKRIADLCSGVGIQSFAFSKTCESVLGIEIDRRKSKYAEENFRSVKNLEFIEGDVLDKKIVQKIKEFKPEIVFCDPERLSEEKERSLDNIKPDIKKIISVYSNLTENICIELPPQMTRDKISELGNSELEYISWNNKLNRLNIYLGDLVKREISVLDISGFRLESNKDVKKAKNISKPLKFVYEISEAVVKAGLVNEICEMLDANILINEKNKLILTSDSLHKNNPLTKCFTVLGFLDSFEEIIKLLKKENIGKVLLKYSVDPKDYWKERKRYEIHLKGEKEATIFKRDKEFLLVN
ncbi:MAG: rRNA adenine N-6-methyltransferase family protein [Nanoarchaeota archaeon]|mgnify:CR=1 FL=1